MLCQVCKVCPLNLQPLPLPTAHRSIYTIVYSCLKVAQYIQYVCVSSFVFVCCYCLEHVYIFVYLVTLQSTANLNIDSEPSNFKAQSAHKSEVY